MNDPNTPLTGEVPGNAVDDGTSTTTTTITTTTSTTPRTRQSSATYTWPYSTTYSTTITRTESTLSMEPQEDPQCYENPMLTRFCSVPEDMKDLSFWDLYSIIFSDSILEALTTGCPKGTWCLQDRFDYWEAQVFERAEMVNNSEIAATMCKPEMISCYDKLEQFYDRCSDFAQIHFAKQAIQLVCHLRENTGLTIECMKQTLVSLHVTVADIIRLAEKNGGEDDDSLDTCESAEAHMTKRLICMENSCPGEESAFREFSPWQWFTVVVKDLIEECGLDPTKCVNVLKVGAHSDFVPTTSSMMSFPGSSFASRFFSSSWFGSSSSTSSSRESSPEVFTMTSASSSLAAIKQEQEMMQPPITDQMIAKEINVMVGMSIGVAVIAVLMGVLGCTLYKRHRRNAVVKDGYQKLLSEADES